MYSEHLQGVDSVGEGHDRGMGWWMVVRAVSIDIVCPVCRGFLSTALARKPYKDNLAFRAAIDDCIFVSTCNIASR